MKKKKLTNKLTINKEVITSLNTDEMMRIKGASIFVACTESCSIFVACCAPVKNIIPDNWIQDKGQG
ncbi:MAG: class I lanthipeptide [Candidatus Aminicenantes bacterium]|nr:class I lanthipeptide [Candidatus Aminicenantes bacterium]